MGASHERGTPVCPGNKTAISVIQDTDKQPGQDTVSVQGLAARNLSDQVEIGAHNDVDEAALEGHPPLCVPVLCHTMY